MAINLDNLDSDLEFVALNTVEGSERGYDQEVVLRNVFYVEDVLNILFHNPKGVIKYNDASFDLSDLNDGAEFVTKWFVKHGHKLDLNVTVVDHNVTISSNDWQRTLKTLQQYNDESEVKALAERRTIKFIKAEASVAGIDEWDDTVEDWEHFVNAFFDSKSKYPCWLCAATSECCKDCTYNHTDYERFKHFKERLKVK